MFIVCQLPFADLRSFIPDTGRLNLPDWLNVQPGNFVRSIGCLRARRRAGLEPWPGEGAYCDARRLVKFPAQLSGIRYLDEYGLASDFRRLMSDGCVTIRLEMGFSRRLYRMRRSKPLHGEQCIRAVTDIMELPVTIRSFDRPMKLIRSSGSLRTDLLAYTSSVGSRRESWWLRIGRPLFYVEYSHNEIAQLPDISRKISPQGLRSISLAHIALGAEGKLSTVWFVGKSGWTDPDELRRLRLHLFRLHAERECLAAVLSAWAAGKVPTERDSPYFDKLQEYLRRASSIFFGKSRYGIERAPLLAAAYSFDDLVSEGDRANLRYRLDEARRNIAKKVETSVLVSGSRQTSEAVQQSITFGGDRSYVAINMGVGNMMQENRPEVDKSVNKGVTVDGDVIGGFLVNSRIDKSFQNIQDSDTGEELKNKLEELTHVVKDISSRLSQEEAQIAARDIETFTAEATSTKPRRTMLEFVGGGLTKLAEAVGDIGAPVASLVTAVLQLIP